MTYEGMTSYEITTTKNQKWGVTQENDSNLCCFVQQLHK